MQRSHRQPSPRFLAPSNPTNLCFSTGSDCGPSSRLGENFSSQFARTEVKTIDLTSLHRSLRNFLGRLAATDRRPPNFFRYDQNFAFVIVVVVVGGQASQAHNHNEVVSTVPRLARRSTSSSNCLSTRRTIITGTEY